MTTRQGSSGNPRNQQEKVKTTVANAAALYVWSKSHQNTNKERVLLEGCLIALWVPSSSQNPPVICSSIIGYSLVPVLNGSRSHLFELLPLFSKIYLYLTVMVHSNYVCFVVTWEALAGRGYQRRSIILTVQPTELMFYIKILFYSEWESKKACRLRWKW